MSAPENQDPAELFKKPLYDPLVPEIKRFELEDGQTAIDVLGTLQSHHETMLPRLGAASLHINDVLTIEYDDDARQEFVIQKVECPSYAFGSDDISNPAITATTTDAAGDKRTVSIHGSCISPSGTMQTPGVVCGQFLMTADREGLQISSGAIRNFELKRPDQTGQLQPVILNRSERPEASESYQNAVQMFETIRQKLSSQGFDFSTTGENGFYNRFLGVQENNLLYAGRQGFGCALTPMEDVYTYDADAGTLRALRFLPEKGIMQFALFEDVSTADFQEASGAYRDGQPDWASPLGVESSTLHRLSHNVPFITYTWANPGVQRPLITVQLPEDAPGRINRPHQTHESGHRLPQVMVDIDSASTKLPIDIKKHNGMWWVDDVEEWSQRVASATAISHTDGEITLKVGKAKVNMPDSIERELEKMLESVKVAIGEFTPRQDKETKLRRASTLIVKRLKS